jgi:hypothetical protein
MNLKSKFRYMFKLNKNTMIIHLIIFTIFLIINFILFFNNENKIHYLTENDSSSTALYFTITTHSTTGYGDVSPVSFPARFCAGLHQIILLIFTTGIISMTLFTQNNINDTGPTK